MPCKHRVQTEAHQYRTRGYLQGNLLSVIKKFHAPIIKFRNNNITTTFVFKLMRFSLGLQPLVFVALEGLHHSNPVHFVTFCQLLVLNEKSIFEMKELNS